MAWLNRVGMILEFISFWFAAPEILGETRLLKIEQKAEIVLKFIRERKLSLIVIFVGAIMMILNISVLVFSLTSENESPFTNDTNDISIAIVSLLILFSIPWMIKENPFKKADARLSQLLDRYPSLGIIIPILLAFLTLFCICFTFPFLQTMSERDLVFGIIFGGLFYISVQLFMMIFWGFIISSYLTV